MPAFLLNKVFLLVALAAAAVLVAASAVAFSNAGEDTGLKQALPTAGPTPSLSASATPTPTPSPTPSPTPTASATPSPTPTPSATPTRSASASATPTRSASASATPRRTFAYPKPTRSYPQLFVELKSQPGSGTVGQTFNVSAYASDGDGEIYMNGLDFGDGTTVAAQNSPRKCKAYPPLTSQPGPYQPSPDEKNFGVYKHQYATPGEYTITMRVASVNADCKPNGPRDESRILQLTVTVTAPAP